MAIAIERDIVRADTQARGFEILVRFGDDLDDLLFKGADVGLFFVGPIIQFENRAMMRMAGDEKDVVELERVLERFTDVRHALPRRRPAEIEADERELGFADRQDDRARVQGIAHLDAGLVLADGIAPHRIADRRRDVDARRAGLQRLGPALERDQMHQDERADDSFHG